METRTRGTAPAPLLASFAQLPLLSAFAACSAALDTVRAIMWQHNGAAVGHAQIVVPTAAHVPVRAMLLPSCFGTVILSELENQPAIRVTLAVTRCFGCTI